MSPVVVVCMLLVVAGALIALRWGHLGVRAPWDVDHGQQEDDGDVSLPSLNVRILRLIWYVNIHLIGALGTGILVIGPGGRLVMRLLAVTSGDAAQGKLTEADEVVGRITVGGTISFVLFVGLFGAVVVAAFFGALRKWLPAGRLGALALTVVSAVVVATRGEPLRPDNEDFGLVGPGWLAVTTFLAVGLLAFLTFTAVAGRASRSLRLPERSVRGLLPYAPLVLLAPLASPSVVLLLVSAAALALLSRPGFRQWWAGRHVLIAGRAVIAVGTVAGLPNFLSDLRQIV